MALDKLRANRQPRDSEAQHTIKVAMAAKQVRDKFAEIQNEISVQFTEGMADRSRDIDEFAMDMFEGIRA